MKVKYKVTASVGKYVKGGEEKTRYIRIGTVFEREDGTECIKLDSLPLGNEWTGWANLYKPKMKEEGYQAAKQSVDDMDDSSTIPF